MLSNTLILFVLLIVYDSDQNNNAMLKVFIYNKSWRKLVGGYKKDLGKRIATYAISSLIISISLSNIVMRRRPYFDHNKIKCLKPRSDEGDIYDTVAQGFSFPSGHSLDIL